jgi:serine protease AprX
MDRINLTTIFFLLVALSAGAQTNQYFVSFKDKTGTPFSVSEPIKFLSTKSIERRNRQGISITVDDLPVNPAYVSQVKLAGATTFFASRWWNGVLIESSAAANAVIATLPFVNSVTFVAPGKKNTSGRVSHTKQKKNSTADLPVNQVQLQQLGLDEMHAQGYRGENINIAIFDSGFIGVDVTSPFSVLFSEDRIKQTFNFVNNSTAVYKKDDHGTEVLSVMAAYSPGSYTGGAHKANYFLYLTEDVGSEYRVEEYNWTIAAERSDSAGVDIINSSLGYNQFDDPSMDYAKADLDGKKAVITRAARKAIDRGIVVVCSAGNEGGNSWKLVTPPSDAEGILAVGSVSRVGSLSSSSSQGPTADSRTKPDVVALGVGTSVIKSNGSVGTASGTSLASPLVASLAAGVLQANPLLSADEIYNAIINSADQSFRPDNLKGYGLPHFIAVKNYLESAKVNEPISVYPNPVTNNIMKVRLKSLTDQPVYLSIYDSKGAVAEELSRQFIWLNNPLEYDLSKLVPGLYFIKVTTSDQTSVVKFVKM